VLRRALAVAALRLRSREFKELEIVVLRHELAVLRRQVAHPRLKDVDRVFLAAASRFLSRTGRQSLFVRPDTLLGWHRRLVRRRWTYAGRRPGRPAVSEGIRELVLRIARENPRWGYQRIVGELAGVGVHVSATTVRSILRQAGVPPAQMQAGLCWREFLRAPPLEIIRTPFRAPRANAFAKRWVGTVRRDCLDWILIVSKRQLEHVLRVYVDHYNGHRPHRALGLTPPTPEPRLRIASPSSPGQHPPTRPTRRTHPRVRRRSVTDELTHPTRWSAVSYLSTER
jgi:integrase-like protein/homeodomain-containing protein